MDPFPPDPPPSPAGLRHALRVTFEYRGADIRIARVERVEMIVPPAVGAPPARDATGYWAEIADAAGRIVWHRPLAQPIAADVEVFSQDRKQTITRVPASRIEGSFAVLVPDVPGGATLSLHGPRDPRTLDAAAGELLQVPLDALRASVTRPSPDATGPRGDERR